MENMNKQLLIGNAAIARGFYEAGATLVSSYPGTPSTEITEYAAQYPELGAEWTANEKVALEVAAGASIAGARTACCMKHVGLNVAADPLFTLSYTGVGGGLVVCVADDPGMHSSQNEQDTRRIALSAKVPCLEPSDSEECKDFTKYAFELSERFDTPVILRTVTRVAHARSAVALDERVEHERPAYQKNVAKYVAMPAFARARHVVKEETLTRLSDYADESPLNRIEWNDKKVGIITGGISYCYAKEAFPDASILKIGMMYPLPRKKILELAQAVDTLLVVEELEPVIEEYCRTLGLTVHGKNMLPLCGEYSVAMLKTLNVGDKQSHATVGAPTYAAPVAAPSNAVVNRPPVMCSGCPHRGVHHLLNKQKKIVLGDIGCYTLGALPPTSSMDACLCMGASIGMAHGMSKVGMPSDKLFAMIGDSTFIHSGMTGLAGAVYNEGAFTLLILDNSITGMTGHQPNPASGMNIRGEPANQIDLEPLVRSLGVKEVDTVDAYDMSALEAAFKRHSEIDAVSVIIVRKPCALLPTYQRGGAYAVLPENCRNCKACIKLGCPSITAGTGHVIIDKATCTGCGLCQSVCPFNAIRRSVDE